MTRLDPQAELCFSGPHCSMAQFCTAFALPSPHLLQVLRGKSGALLPAWAWMPKSSWLRKGH